MIRVSPDLEYQVGNEECQGSSWFGAPNGSHPYYRCIDELSMFVLSKWQFLALFGAPSVRTLFYWYLLCGPRRCEINIKVRAPRHVNASGAPHIVTWTKQTWIKHQCTVISRMGWNVDGSFFWRENVKICWRKENIGTEVEFTKIRFEPASDPFIESVSLST